MRLTVAELKQHIREAISDDCWGSSHPDEMYEEQLMDDPVMSKKSTYVPDDVKDRIRKYFKSMGLSK